MSLPGNMYKLLVDLMPFIDALIVISVRYLRGLIDGLRLKFSIY